MTPLMPLAMLLMLLVMPQTTLLTPLAMLQTTLLTQSTSNFYSTQKHDLTGSHSFAAHTVSINNCKPCPSGYGLFFWYLHQVPTNSRRPTGSG